MQTEVQDKTNFVTVQVHEQDGFSVVFPDGSQEDAFSKQDLILALNRAKEEGGEDLNTLSVEAHEESTHGAVVSALDAGRAANFLTFRTTVVEQFQ
jgi:biopolymer transport protein ExbD